MKSGIAIITVGIVLLVGGGFILFRYNIVPGGGDMVYRMDRWTGATHLCDGELKKCRYIQNRPLSGLRGCN
jgi:hypothetical protein